MWWTKAARSIKDWKINKTHPAGSKTVWEERAREMKRIRKDRARESASDSKFPKCHQKKRILLLSCGSHQQVCHSCSCTSRFGPDGQSLQDRFLTTKGWGINLLHLLPWWQPVKAYSCFGVFGKMCSFTRWAQLRGFYKRGCSSGHKLKITSPVPGIPGSLESLTCSLRHIHLNVCESLFSYSLEFQTCNKRSF